MSSTEPSLIVGIGASAGGLEPLERFFAATALDTGMAFVVVQHLSPDYPSLMSELLARHTKLQIHRVKDGMKVGPNAIYLIPPRMNMVIRDGVLGLVAQEREEEHPPLPIDIFFRSLAENSGDKAVAIVLSGTGTDGSRGVKEVKRAGGLVLVQDEFTAKFNGMPKAASDTGVVDAAFSPDEMPGYLVAYEKDPETPAAQEDEEESLEGIDAVLNLLNRHHDIDFSQYKPSTVHRRIERRIMLGTDPTIDTYVERLRSDPEELNRLYKDMLIGVTQFFRDAAAYESLNKHVIPNIFQARSPEEEIRVWVAGCATGEEAYSIAILFNEARQKLGRHGQPIRIFATDAHRTSIDFASAGRYQADSLREVMPDRLSQYFAPIGNEFQVIPSLRQMITFAPQNMITDAPFTRMDLVTCRNVMIYFQQQIQTQVISLLHFALNTSGFLFLGPSETTQPFREEFEALDPHWRIYRKRRDVRLLSTTRLPTRTPTLTPPRQAIPTVSSGALAPDTRLLRVYDALLEDAIDAAVLVNERREVVHVFGQARDFLKLPQGRRAYDVLSMLDDPLKPAVGAAIQKARNERGLISMGMVRIDDDNVVKVSARPMLDGTEGAQSFVLIRLDKIKRAAPPPSLNDDGSPELTFDASGVNQQRLVALEQELQYSKENLQTTIEELETTNEELNATNEELIASNEELQSTNEELHSVNEELHTVNAEYQQKITELTQLTDDMNNLLASTDIGTLFLDRDLNIRRFTPAVEGLMKVRSADVGRPLDEISKTFWYKNLLEDAADTIATGNVHLTEVRSKTQDNYYLVRINPYRLANGNIDGLVITFVDIDKIKQAESAAQTERKLTQDILDTLPSMVFFKDDKNNIIRVNRAAAEKMGLPKEQIEGKATADFFPEDADAYLLDDLEVVNSGVPKLGIVERFVTPEGDRRWIKTDKLPLIPDADGARGVVAVVSDITELRRAQAKLEVITQRFERFMANSPAIKWAVDSEGNYVFVNPAFEKTFGVKAQDCIGRHPTEVLAEHTTEAFFKKSRDTNTQARLKKEPVTFEIEFPIGDDRFWFLVTKFVFNDADNQEFVGGSGIDITALKRAERDLEQLNAELEARVVQRTVELAESEERFQLAADSAPIMMWMHGTDGGKTWCNKGWLEFAGKEMQEMLGDGWLDMVHPDDREGMIAAWNKTVAKHERWDYDFRARRADGEYRWMYTFGMPRYDKAENYIGYIGTMSDVTERRQAEDRLQQAHDHLERRVEERTGELQVNLESLAARNHELDQFAHAASHDLRSPLRTILGFVEHLRELRDDTVDEEERDAMDRIDGAANRMSQLIDSLLVFATVGRGELRLRSINPHLLIQEVQTDLAPEIEAAGTQLRIQSPLPEVTADPTMLRQVFQNLISNAIKFRRGDPPVVSVGTERREDAVYFTIKDNGIGFDPKDLERVFEPFQRLHQGKNFRGTGIGLSICLRVVERHGGTIKADSELGAGSTFTFSIPHHPDARG